MGSELRIDQFTLDGGSKASTLNTESHQTLESLKALSLSLRFGYSQNWVWTHWFIGLAGGFGGNFNEVKARFFDSNSQVSESKAHFNSLVALSAGYKWGQSKVGLFARGYTWQLAVDSITLSSNTSTSGFYYSSTF